MARPVARILVVDDAPFIRRWAESVLVRAGHEVLQAGDGDEALTLYRLHRPDAVFLDVLMPGRGGVQTLRELRKIDPNARVAMLTVEANVDVVLEAQKYGVRDFLLKPCSADRLIEGVNRSLPA